MRLAGKPAFAVRSSMRESNTPWQLSASLKSVKVPVLFTHHFRHVDANSGVLMGAISDLQAARVKELISGAGQRFDYRSFPQMAHSMHGQDPELFTATLVEWVKTVQTP